MPEWNDAIAKGGRGGPPKGGAGGKKSAGKWRSLEGEGEATRGAAGGGAAAPASGAKAKATPKAAAKGEPPGESPAEPAEAEPLPALEWGQSKGGSWADDDADDDDGGEGGGGGGTDDGDASPATVSASPPRAVDAPTDMSAPWRSLPPYPTHDELHNDGTAAQQQRGVYVDAREYVSAQYAMLREDMVSPLRAAIGAHRGAGGAGERAPAAGTDEAAPADPADPAGAGCHVYTDIELVSLRCGPRGIVYRLRYRGARVEWRDGPPLRVGSLLAISSDDFESVTWAKIVGHNNNGAATTATCHTATVDVTLAEGTHTPLHAAHARGAKCVMAASPADLESCIGALAAIQTVDPATLPFSRTLAAADDSPIGPPAYLGSRGADKYAMRGVFPALPKALGGAFSLLEEWPKELASAGGLDDAQARCCRCRGGGPRCDCCRSDLVQMRALRVALTKSVALVDGGPATGKAHVANLALRALSDNGAKHGAAPVLVLCASGGGLDRLVASVRAFEPRVLRVGPISAKSRPDNADTPAATFASLIGAERTRDESSASTWRELCARSDELRAAIEALGASLEQKSPSAEDLEEAPLLLLLRRRWFCRGEYALRGCAGVQHDADHVDVRGARGLARSRGCARRMARSGAHRRQSRRRDGGGCAWARLGGRGGGQRIRGGSGVRMLDRWR